MNTCEISGHYLNYYVIYILNLRTNLNFVLEWQRLLQVVSHNNHNLSANEDFVIFFTSKLITGFIDGFILGMKS